MIKNRHYRALELDKVLQLLSREASCSESQERILSMEPSTGLYEVKLLLQETDDAHMLTGRFGSPSFGGLQNVANSLRRAQAGASLSMGELLKVAEVLRVMRGLTQWRKRSEGLETSIDWRFEALTPNKYLEEKIASSILSEEEMADGASQALGDIRRKINAASLRVREKLDHMIHSPAYQKYLQEPIVTLRGGRFVVPVKAECRGEVPGLVHDTSGSGATVFVEPMAVVEANNDIKVLKSKEEAEIERILYELSQEAGGFADSIIEGYNAAIELDILFAKAKLAYRMKATLPEVNDQGKIYLKKARHPLIDPKAVVATDIELGLQFDTLVITGPNTGGKTVSLKTTGLFCLMGQAGLHIPALDRSELSIFREVYADIGDEQSIEQSLSTFSSHMTSIVSILKNANADSLCLFDELGAGTDPTEGAALAIAILNFLHDRGIRTMATTHYSELKVYALSTSFVENACCEFDVESLRPTYRLLIGIPGKSNAFAISSRLGLSDDIINSARTQISAEAKSFEDLLTDLEQSRVTIEKEQLEIASYKREVEALKKQLEAKQEKIDQAKERILREANEQAREILQDAKNTADETIRAFQKAGPGASMKDLEKARENLRGKISDKNEKLAVKNQQPAQSGVKPSQLKLGESVRIVSMGLKGTVSTMPDNKGNLFVQCGIIRTQTNIRDLVLIQEKDASATAKAGRTGSGKIRMSKSLSISSEINLLGKTVDEAMSMLDKYLDDAYLAHLSTVRIVHGKGTGALRNAVQNHLRKVKYVKSYRLGEYGEGDAGVTIVEFKS